MKITNEQLCLLQKYGFKWYKNQCTDSVDPKHILSIASAANGFTVIYSKDSVLEYSTAIVEKIEFPPDDLLNKQWIYVHWINIEDQRRDREEPSSTAPKHC
jgi:hypothetical protein